MKDLLDYPILYLSRFIIRNKGEYYRLLQAVRDNGDSEEWILFMLEGIIQTASETVNVIKAIRELMMEYKTNIRKTLPKIYSKDLLENLFKHPYTKIDFLQKDLQVSYHTARTYLKKLSDNGFLEKRQVGIYNFYINVPLLNLFLK